MPIEFRCTQCGRLLRTPDDSAGRQAKCPECGNVQVIPGPSAPPPLPPSVPPEAAPVESPFGGAVPPGGGYDPNQAYPTPQDAMGRVNGPGIALIVTGALGIALQLANLVALIADPQMLQRLAGGNNPNVQFQGIPNAVAIGMYSFSLLLGVLIIYGGIKMRNLENYSLAMASPIIAMIPCISPCCCVGLPIGIWALVVLFDANVKAAFRS
jgi:hypothetical protein